MEVINILSTWLITYEEITSVYQFLIRLVHNSWYQNQSTTVLDGGVDTLIENRPSAIENLGSRVVVWRRVVARVFIWTFDPLYFEKKIQIWDCTSIVNIKIYNVTEKSGCNAVGNLQPEIGLQMYDLKF